MCDTGIEIAEANAIRVNLPKFLLTINNINEIRDSISSKLTKEGFDYDKKKNIWNLTIG